jgi:hypothetical protein
MSGIFGPGMHSLWTGLLLGIKTIRISLGVEDGKFRDLGKAEVMRDQ